MVLSYTITLNVEIDARGKERLTAYCSDSRITPRMIINQMRQAADSLEYQDILLEVTQAFEAELRSTPMGKHLRVVK